MPARSLLPRNMTGAVSVSGVLFLRYRTRFLRQPPERMSGTGDIKVKVRLCKVVLLIVMQSHGSLGTHLTVAHDTLRIDMI